MNWANEVWIALRAGLRTQRLTSCVWLNSNLPVMVSKMCAVMCAFPGCSGVDPVARNMVLGLRYFSFRLLSPRTCRYHAVHIPTA